MSARSHSQRGPLALRLMLGLSLGAGCSDGEDGDPPDMGASATSDPASTGSTTSTTGDAGTGTGTGTSGDGGSSDDGGEPSSTGEADTTGTDMGPSDPNLDRSAPNILDDPDLCGYPGPGPYGYGGIIEQNRFPNFVLEDCDGNQREFAELFCQRDDPEYMDYNHVFIVVFETVW